MSRAFVKEPESDVIILPDRPISTQPNLVTQGGLAAIESALHRFEAAHRAAAEKGDEHAAATDLREVRYWKARLASARVVKPPADKTYAHFAAKVTIRRDDGREQTFRIVGDDEANPSRGTVSRASPIARAVIGHKVGETVDIAGHEATILKIDKANALWTDKAAQSRNVLYVTGDTRIHQTGRARGSVLSPFQVVTSLSFATGSVRYPGR